MAEVRKQEEDYQHIREQLVEEMKPDDIATAKQQAALCLNSKFKACLHPMDRVEPVTDDAWFAIVGAHKKREQAEAQAVKIGSLWSAMKSDECPRYAKGNWIVASGPFPIVLAKRQAEEVIKFEAYAKKCAR